MSLNYKKHWRTSTALCIASTVLVATAAYAAHYPGGHSDWDKRSHHNHRAHQEADRARNDHGGEHGDKDHGGKTASPIKHVIILIGENRGLDHTFGVYKPKGKGQTISNLLSKGIVNEDGTPGPNFAQAQQFSVAGQPSFYIGAPAIAKSPYNATNAMPQPNTNGNRPRRATPGHRSRRSRKPVSRRTWIRAISTSSPPASAACRPVCLIPAFPAPAV